MENGVNLTIPRWPIGRKLKDKESVDGEYHGR